MLLICRAVALCTFLLTCSSFAAPAIVGESPTLSRTDGIVSAIRLRLGAYERAWNQGDISAVLDQYHPSMFAIFRSAYVDYAEYTRAVRDMMLNGHQLLKLEIKTVRLLGKDHAIANGRVYTIAKDGSRQDAFFTVVYARFGGKWRLIYSHS